MSKVDINAVLDRLHGERLLTDRTMADTILAEMALVQPWYVRTMVGFGAWLASLMLIGFFTGIGIAFDGGYIVIGALLAGAGCYLRRNNDTDFMVQVSLAAALCGQALFAYGCTEVLGVGSMKGLLLLTMVVSTAMYWLFPDRTLRVLELLFIAAAAVASLYAWHLQEFVPVVGPLLVAAMLFLQHHEAKWVVSGKSDLMRPAINGLMLAAFGCLLMSAVYLLPELVQNLSLYPRPWISTLLLGVLLLYQGSRIWPVLFAGNRTAIFIGYGLTLAVIAAAWANPGLLLALIVVSAGTLAGSRSMVGAGIAFLVVFIAMYFYGIEVTMLTKSITLVGAGSVILIVRRIILTLTTAGTADV